jgi:hypothetical protein
MPNDKLLKNAINHYNSLWADRGKFEKSASEDSDKDFLNRIKVNYLRHNCSNYEEELENIFNQIGKDDGYFLLKKRILFEIGCVYNDLKPECERQASELEIC